MIELRSRSKAWYILPIFIGIIGDIIAYFAVRNDDPKLDKNCLIVGIIVLAINLTAGLFIGLLS